MSNTAHKIQPVTEAAENPQKKAIFSAIRQLVNGLSAAERAFFIQELARENGVDSPRAGGVLATVLRLIPKGQEFSADDIQRSVDAVGVETSRKEIHNALGYLRKKNQIQRVGHGRYIIDGALYETIEDLGVGPPTRHEIDDT